MDKKSIKVNDLINIIDNEYPLTNAANWDQHLGLVVWNKKELVSKILICLDVTSELVEDCVKNNIDFIVSYHPFLFCNTIKEEWILYPYKRKIYQKLKKYKISLYTIHTSYDYHPKGASFNLSNLLKINNYCLPDNNYGLLIKERTNTLDLINHLKKTFNLDYLETTFDKHFKIDKYLFLLGSGDPYSIHYTKTKLVITSDIKWSSYILAREQKINLIKIPHYIEEFVFLKTFYNLLDPYIDVFVYKNKQKIYIL